MGLEYTQVMFCEQETGMRAAEGVGPYMGTRIAPFGDQARLWKGCALFMRRRPVAALLASSCKGEARRMRAWASPGPMV